MILKHSKDAATTAEKKQEQIHAPTRQSTSERKTLKLRLLRNCFVQGAFGKKGQEYTFPREEAQQRLQKTNGVWEAVDSQ